MTRWMIRFPALLLAVVAWLLLPLVHAQEKGGTQTEQSPVAHYPFDGNANDASGNRYDGLVFGPILTADRFDNPRSAYEFDGDFDLIGLPHEVLDGLSDVTTTFWLKTSKTGEQVIVSGANRIRDNEYTLFFPNPSTLRFHSNGNRPRLCHIDMPPIADGRWHHMAVVRNATLGNAILYIDGKGLPANCQFLPYDPLNIEEGGLIIGLEQDELGGGLDPSQAFVGVLDDLRIYNYVLTPAEVDALFRENGWTSVDSGPSGPFAIASITDVPNDQGRQVSLTWTKHPYDIPDPETLITEYSAWRKIDPDLAAGKELPDPDVRGTPEGRWHFIQKVPANQSEEYSVVVPTLADSTITAGIYYSTFFVQAHTAFPNIHFSTEPARGYSVDNLEPRTPAQFAFTATKAGKALLTWEQVLDEDFAYYALFRGNTMSFVPDGVFYTTVDTQFEDTIDEEDHFYRIAAFDFAGNSSPLSNSLDVALDIHTDAAFVRQMGQPQVFALLPNFPNPFNPATTIRYDLQEEAQVRLQVYALTGQLVRTLVDLHQPAGHYSTQWDGRDRTGAPVGTGLYLYELEAGEFRAVRKMVLTK